MLLKPAAAVFKYARYAFWPAVLISSLNAGGYNAVRNENHEYQLAKHNRRPEFFV